MNPNPVLKKLGFSDQDRLLIIHADDIGMCQSTLPAYSDLLDFGLVTSGGRHDAMRLVSGRRRFCPPKPGL